MRVPILLVLLLTLSVLMTVDLSAQAQGAMKDARDGKIYATISYEVTEGGKKYPLTWMAENLNYQTSESYCLQDSLANCEKYGRLYTWFAAQKACPEGWHLPTDEEWYLLAGLYGGVAEAGRHLKSEKTEWVRGKHSGESGFNGLPGGARDPMEGAYFKYGTTAFFWSATEVGDKPEEAYDWSFVSWSEELRHWEGGKFIGNSCRCVKDRVE